MPARQDKLTLTRPGSAFYRRGGRSTSSDPCHDGRADDLRHIAACNPRRDWHLCSGAIASGGRGESLFGDVFSRLDQSSAPPPSPLICSGCRRGLLTSVESALADVGLRLGSLVTSGVGVCRGMAGVRDPRLKECATVARARHDQRTAHGLDPVGQADQARAGRIRPSDPVVLDEGDDQVRFGGDDHLAPARAGVLRHVGDRLGAEEEQRPFERVGKPSHIDSYTRPYRRSKTRPPRQIDG